MNNFKPKITDVVIEKAIPDPCDDAIFQFIFDLNEHRKKMVLEDCYPESIVISMRCLDMYGEQGDGLVIKGWRPENGKERVKRLEKSKKTKELKIKYKEEAKQRRYNQFIQLKKEFQNK